MAALMISPRRTVVLRPPPLRHFRHRPPSSRPRCAAAAATCTSAAAWPAFAADNVSRSLLFMPLLPPQALPPPQGPPSPSPIMVSIAIFSRLCPVASGTALNRMQLPSRRSSSRYCPATTVQCRLQPSPPAASSFPRTTCVRPRLTRSIACCLRRLRSSRCQRPSLVTHAKALASCSTVCLLGSPSGKI